MQDPRVGTVVAGRYRIERRLAAGGMGVVYEAVQEPLGRRVALKVIRGEAVDDPVARLRFEREAKTASSLQDAHVVVVHDFGVLDAAREDGGGGLFLAMEFVDGETLRSRLVRDGRLMWKRSLVVVEHVARALSAAHAKELVHRDLKPENIMLVPTSGEGADAFSCKVLDFGLAKGVHDDLLKSSDGKPLTRSGGFVGTPGYISPEHIDGAVEDPRQDVYALGVVWWEMLTGRHPFPAETPMKTLLRQMHEDPPPLDDVLRLADGIPPAGAQLVRDMMARAPQGRPRDGAAVLARLASLDDAPGTLQAKQRLIDSNAPTISSTARPPLIDVPMIVSPGANRTSDVLTVNQRPPPPAADPPPTTSTPSGFRPRRARRSLVALLLGCSVFGTIAGAIIIKVLDDKNIIDEPPPPPPPVVDAGTFIPMTTDIVVEGVTTFSGISAVRKLLPADHRLRVYRPQKSELSVEGDQGGAMADLLDGKVIDVGGGATLTLEVREIDRGRVVVVALAVVDGGVSDQVLDAGGAVVPGGLEP